VSRKAFIESIVDNSVSVKRVSGGSIMTILDPIETLIRSKRWIQAREAISAELRTHPNDHWLLTRMGLTFYQCQNYSTALEWALKAWTLTPTCPLVLWDLAGTQQMLDRHQEACELYQLIIRRGPKRIAKGPCGEGLARARGLVCDCHYRLAESLRGLGLREESDIAFHNHLDERGPGCRSIYPLQTNQSFWMRTNVRETDKRRNHHDLERLTMARAAPRLQSTRGANGGSA